MLSEWVSEWDVKPYTLTHSLNMQGLLVDITYDLSNWEWLEFFTLPYLPNCDSHMCYSSTLISPVLLWYLNSLQITTQSGQICISFARLKVKMLLAPPGALPWTPLKANARPHYRLGLHAPHEPPLLQRSLHPWCCPVNSLPCATITVWQYHWYTTVIAVQSAVSLFAKINDWLITWLMSIFIYSSRHGHGLFALTQSSSTHQLPDPIHRKVKQFDAA